MWMLVLLVDSGWSWNVGFRASLYIRLSSRSLHIPPSIVWLWTWFNVMQAMLELSHAVDCFRLCPSHSTSHSQQTINGAQRYRANHGYSQCLVQSLEASALSLHDVTGHRGLAQTLCFSAITPPQGTASELLFRRHASCWCPYFIRWSSPG